MILHVGYVDLVNVNGSHGQRFVAVEVGVFGDGVVDALAVQIVVNHDAVHIVTVDGLQISGHDGVGGIQGILQGLYFADGLDLAGGFIFLPADFTAIEGAVVVRAAPDLDQADALAELVDHGVEQNGDQGLILLEQLGDAGELLILTVGIELGIEADDLHIRILLGDALQEGVGTILVTVADEDAVIAGGGAGGNGILPFVEVTAAEVHVALYVQGLAQVLTGVGPHLENGGRGKQHDVRNFLAGDGVGGLGTCGCQHGQRQHQSEDHSDYFLHGITSYFVPAGNTRFFVKQSILHVK